MAIRPTKLRAVFLLLLFTLLLICSNSLITEVNADSLEESFKNTPLPFWEINNENCLTQYGTNSQDIIFNYGTWITDFNELTSWIIFSGNGELIFEANSMKIITPHDSVYTWSYANTPNDLSIQNCKYKTRYKLNYTGSGASFYSNLYKDIDMTGGLSYQILYADGVADVWNIQEGYINDADIVKSIAFGAKSTSGVIALEVEVDYFYIWKQYNEDMTDVSDWAYHASNSLAGGEYGFDTDGDVGELWLILGSSGENEWVLYKTPMNYLITSRTKFEIRSKVENTAITLSTRITGTDLDDWPNSNTNTDWLIQNPDITDHAEKTIDYLYIQVNDVPDSGGAANYSGYFDYINIWEEGGTLNVSIPIEQFKNHKLEFMLDTDDLENTTKLDFGTFQNNEPMNYEFSLENQTLTQREFSFDYSEYNYLRFVLDLKYSTNYFKLSGYDENNSKLFSNIIYEYVRKTGNNFKISSDNFTGWFHLYYFTGDVDYSTVWTETIYSEDLDITTNLLGASAVADDFLDAHNISYNRYVSNFQFLRTNLNLWSDFSVDHSEELGVYITTQLFYPDGTEAYKVILQFRRATQSFRYYLTVYEDNVIVYWGSALTGALGVESQTNIQFAVWRTQDNKLGAVVYTDDTFSNYYGDIAPFVSDLELENFQANVTVNYYSESHVSGYRNFILELNGFEFGYGRVEGVAEPHFSTTWWDLIPFLGPIIGAMVLVGNGIIFAIETGLLPITSFLDVIFGAIGGIAGSVWVLFESALSDLGISVDAIASDVFGFFDGILTAISGLVDDVITGITNLNDNFVDWVITGITDALVPALVDGIDTLMDALFALWEYQLNLVGTALGWGDIGTFLFDLTDSVVLTIPSWIEFIINANLMMIDIFVFANALYAEYGATFILYGSLFVAIDILTAVMTMDLDIIGECLTKYIKVLVWIAEFMLSIISTVLNAIWGILPF